MSVHYNKRMISNGGHTRSNSQKPVVLVVDDDEDIADTYSMWLEDEYDVRTAYSGHEAVEQVNDEVDVVLLDRRMPNMPGDEVLERIREEGTDCMVSMLTAVKPTQELTELEFDEYLNKPVSKTQILATVEELLLRDQMGEETQEYLAMKATADTVEENATEEKEAGKLEELRSDLRDVESDPSVQEETRELERLLHLSELARSINRAVIRSDSREELGQAICQEFVEDLPYERAVFGEFPSNHDEFIPNAWNEGELELGPVSCPAEGPLRTAVEESEVTVASLSSQVGEGVDRIHRTVADDSTFDTAIAVPVMYQETTRGGTVLFADESIELSERERSTLLEVGEAAGNAVKSLQTRELVDTDSVVELELGVTDREDIFIDLSAEYDCRIHVDGVHQKSEDEVVCYLTVHTRSAEEIMGFFAEKESVENYHVVDDTGGDILLQCLVSDSAIIVEITRAPAGLVEFYAEEGVGNLSVQFAPDIDLREILETLKSDFGDIELVSKQYTETPYQSVGRFRGTVDDRLTERQDEVISAAFRSGYFDWPRDSTAEDIAEMLELAPPTLHEHLREAERKLVETYLEETDITESLPE